MTLGLRPQDEGEAASAGARRGQRIWALSGRCLCGQGAQGWPLTEGAAPVRMRRGCEMWETGPCGRSARPVVWASGGEEGQGGLTFSALTFWLGREAVLGV